MNAAVDAVYMAEAFRLAERGLYTAQPNPRVGAVVVKDGDVLGRGYHLRRGEAHAEANALREAGASAAGATLYCTLEPCSFHGLTPSCAQGVIDAGISRVVVAMTDPHPKNAGAGLAMLRKAGIDVVCPFMESSAIELNPGHVKRFETELPYVRVKVAMTLDGKTALANGESRWITGAAARRDVQKLRARSSAIVTGVQTIVDDDPALTVRAPELGVEHAGISAGLERRIVVLDPELRIPPSSGVLANPNTIVACLEDPANAIDLSCEKMVLPSNGARRIDLEALLRQLAKLECNEILFECGATLAGAVIGAGLADELVIYAAPAVLGADARSLLELAKIDSMRDRIEFSIADVRHVGADIRMTCIPISRG